MEIQVPLGRNRASGRVELVDRVAYVSLEQQQARVAKLESPVAGAHDRHHRGVERESLIRGVRLQCSRVTTGE